MEDPTGPKDIAPKQKRKFSSFFKNLVIELDRDLYGPDNHLVEVCVDFFSSLFISSLGHKIAIPLLLLLSMMATVICEIFLSMFVEVIFLCFFTN